MKERLKALIEAIRAAFARTPSVAARAAEPVRNSARTLGQGLVARRGAILGLAVVIGAGALVYANPPVQTVGRGEIGLRTNHFTAELTEWHEGSVIVLPGVHGFRVVSTRDQLYRPTGAQRADGAAPLQSLEGLSLGVDLSVRYAVDTTRLREMASRLPDDIAGEVVAPAVQGTIYKVFAKHTVREIFATKRADIQQAIEAELKTRLANDGIALRGVLIGKVDLPADYRRGMESLLAEELASEKMRYTLALKEKRVKETLLDAEAEKVRREKVAEAAGREQIIAARSQEEAMKHVLPFKQRQVEQRQLEAEAEKQARIRAAEGNAQARRIEASGEAEARQKLADAELYRLERINKANAEQMAREGTLVTAHPLLVQKALADKLSDKVQVIIAPPPADQGFIGANLVGSGKK